MNKGKQTKGIALISVLFVAAVVLILASTFIFMITRENQTNRTSLQVSDAVQFADAVSERARIQLVNIYKESELSAEVFLANFASGKPNAYLKNPQPITVNGRNAQWQVRAVAEKPVGSAPWVQWLEIVATYEADGNAQTVIRRVNFGESDPFNLALLARDTNCVYCHLRVRGDVGSLGFLRPGWGREGLEGHNSAGANKDSTRGALTTGTAFVVKSKDPTIDADNLSNDGIADTVNGAVFGSIEINSTSNNLPKDKTGDGIADFPPIRRGVAEQGATGSISGGIVYTLNPGDTLSGLPSSSNNTGIINKNHTGNVVLIGTEANPIVLDGDIYIDGDVVIKGYVKGRGAIYASRNTYVAGNINYVNAPQNCALPSVSDPNQCAKDALAANKDELRLAARGNIVLGNYTEKNADGSKRNWSDLQASEFYRKQFGFNDATKNKSYLPNGDELEYNPVTDKYNDTEGNEYAKTDPQIITKNAVDAYDYSMKPGRIQSGNFQSWLPDNVYQDILGTQTRRYDTWRYDVDQDYANGRADLTTAILNQQFAKYNLSSDTMSDLLDLTKNVVVLKDSAGNRIGHALWHNNKTLRVIIDAPSTPENQVTHVDAFLYANQRIAGKTFNAPLVVNGGLVATQIGILAPGIERQWWQKYKADGTWSDTDALYNVLNRGDSGCSGSSSADQDFLKELANIPAGGDHKDSFAYAPDADGCAFTINYDYRLRNGGLGFNLVTLNVGQTISWQLADKKNERVQ